MSRFSKGWILQHFVWFGAAPFVATALALGCADGGETGGNAPGFTAGTTGGAGAGGSAGMAGASATGGASGAAGMIASGGMSGGASGVGGAGAAGGGGTMAGTGGTAGNPMIGEFINLAPPMGAALTEAESSMPATPPPAGWKWYAIENTFCRDGSGNGIYVRDTGADKLLIYFEGGGACTTAGFCHFNPHNVDSVLTGDGETVLGTALAVGEGRQMPGAYTFGALEGIFAENNTQNPFNGWNMVYIPYCTGDVHFGTNEAGTVPNVPEKQKFVGYLNTKNFVSRIVPTFKDRVSRVVVTGASAGSFGAALNFSMISDSFNPVRVDAILDSGAPFEDAQWPACLQKSWREIWGLNDSLPPDCTECFNADGGGMIGLADFLMRKHAVGNVAAISGVHDEVIRLFFTPGENNCEIIATADPFEITAGQILGVELYPADKYQTALINLREKYVSTGRLASYLFGGEISSLHQHTFRARFYEPVTGGKTIAQFVTEFLDGTMTQVGP